MFCGYVGGTIAFDSARVLSGEPLGASTAVGVGMAAGGQGRTARDESVFSGTVGGTIALIVPEWLSGDGSGDTAGPGAGSEACSRRTLCDVQEIRVGVYPLCAC